MTNSRGTANQTDRTSAKVRWWIWLSDPIVISLYAAIPFLLAFFLSEVARISYPDALGAIVSLSESARAHSFDVTAVIATVLVALAAATNFGEGSAALSERTRTFILVSLVVCILTILVLVSASLVAAVVDSKAAFESIVILAIGWICLLVSHVVFGEVSEAERSRTARAQWKAMKRRAADYDIRRGPAMSLWRRLVAELIFWVVPFVGWVVLGVVISGWSGLIAFGSPVFAIVVLLHLPVTISALGWRATADLSGSRAVRYAVRGGAVAAAAAVVASLLFVMLAWSYLVPLAIAFPVFQRPLSRRSLCHTASASASNPSGGGSRGHHGLSPESAREVHSFTYRRERVARERSPLPRHPGSVKLESMRLKF